MATWAAISIVALALSQSGWSLTQASPREVRRLYWELIPETEVWLRLIPEDPEGKPPLINLVFHAFYPGRAERDPSTGLPARPKGKPKRLTVSAEPLPQTLVRELSLRLVIDGQTLDLTGPNGTHRNLPCLVGTEDCTPNAVEAELDASVLQSLAKARSVVGEALGFRITLVVADQLALGDFLARVGLSTDRPQED